jgi:hypothetical protein
MVLKNFLEQMLQSFIPEIYGLSIEHLAELQPLKVGPKNEKMRFWHFWLHFNATRKSSGICPFDTH